MFTNLVFCFSGSNIIYASTKLTEDVYQELGISRLSGNFASHWRLKPSQEPIYLLVTNLHSGVIKIFFDIPSSRQVKNVHTSLELLN